MLNMQKKTSAIYESQDLKAILVFRKYAALMTKQPGIQIHMRELLTVNPRHSKQGKYQGQI